MLLDVVASRVAVMKSNFHYVAAHPGWHQNSSPKNRTVQRNVTFIVTGLSCGKWLAKVSLGKACPLNR